MKVTNIDIAGLRFDGKMGRHEGQVSMELRPSREGGPMHVHFVCHSDQPFDGPATLIAQDMIRDALRQAHRMPGYRRGERKIVVEVERPNLAALRASA